MDKSRQLAVDILKRVTEDGAYSSIELDKALFSANLTNQDAAFVTNMIYGTLNNLYSIDRIIETYSTIKLKKMESLILNVLRLGIYQLKYMDRVPDYSAINEMVNIAKKSSERGANFVNAILRSYARKDKDVVLKSEIDRLSFEYSMPMFITEIIKSQYKKRTKEILEGLRRSEGLFIRINRTLIDRESYIKEAELKEGEFEYGLLPDFIYLKDPGNVRKLYGYDEGFFSVQNESAGFVSYAFVDKSGLALDICAAPGGKSLYLKELNNNQISVTSNDFYEAKRNIILENAQRLKLDLKVTISDATITNDELKNSFDLVICDVPCSGLGLLGRKPDIKLNITSEDIEDIIKIQEKILKNASLYLKENGIMIYSTCTLNKEENEFQVFKFLENNPEYEIIHLNISDLLLKSARNGGIKNFIIKDEMITVLPDKKYDGFFICGLKKKEETCKNLYE